MMWAKTKYLGCGVYTCSNGWSVYTCHYSPAGNVRGKSIFSEKNYRRLCGSEDNWRTCNKLAKTPKSLQIALPRFEDDLGFWIRLFMMSTEDVQFACCRKLEQQGCIKGQKPDKDDDSKGGQVFKNRWRHKNQSDRPFSQHKPLPENIFVSKPFKVC